VLKYSAVILPSLAASVIYPLTIIDEASAPIFRATTIGPANRQHEAADRRAFFP